MKHPIALACVFAAGIVQTATAPAALAQNIQPPHTTLKEGDMAPDFTLPSTQGGKVTLSSFRGKNAVVLAFFPAAFTGG
jgi:cytochrome oxidase Cu insertion factor (SCO1/SenC/PrrC family)